MPIASTGRLFESCSLPQKRAPRGLYDPRLGAAPLSCLQQQYICWRHSCSRPRPPSLCIAYRMRSAAAAITLRVQPSPRSSCWLLCVRGTHRGRQGGAGPTYRHTSRRHGTCMVPPQSEADDTICAEQHGGGGADGGLQAGIAADDDFSTSIGSSHTRDSSRHSYPAHGCRSHWRMCGKTLFLRWRRRPTAKPARLPLRCSRQQLARRNKGERGTLRRAAVCNTAPARAAPLSARTPEFYLVHGV